MDQQLDASLSALSNPSRRANIARLADQGPTRVTELALPFDMSLNAISKHLKVLETAGLVTRHKIGREHLIAFDPRPLKKVSRWINHYETFWCEKLDDLERHFLKQNDGEKL